jgi:hypothetical protein
MVRAFPTLVGSLQAWDLVSLAAAATSRYSPSTVDRRYRASLRPDVVMAGAVALVGLQPARDWVSPAAAEASRYSLSADDHRHQVSPDWEMARGGPPQNLGSVSPAAAATSRCQAAHARQGRASAARQQDPL